MAIENYSSDKIKLDTIIKTFQSISEETNLEKDNVKNKYKTEVALSEPLTVRELEVLKLIAAGMSNKEIAKSLEIKVSTVKTHTLNVYGKLGVNRRVQAVMRAKDLKLLKEK